MIATYKVLSAVLSYPTADLQRHARQMLAALNAEQLLPAYNRAAVGVLIEEIAAADLLEAESRYVDLFDRTRSLSLHMFEHVHGESRDRGQAMVSLQERYQQAGLDVTGQELPDYIPLFLEFLSTLSAAEARSHLAEPAHILAALGERLRKRDSAYGAVLEALVVLSQVSPSQEALDMLRKTPSDDPLDLAALDRIWEETEVRFGPGDAGTDACPKANDILSRMTASVEKSSGESMAETGT
jgi:nitrate reductase delta subunit